MSQRVLRTMHRSLARLPKAELHTHLEGAMRFDTLVALCQKHAVGVPPDTRGQRFANFGNFVATYVAACECLREEADLARLVLEVAEDAKACGAAWIEPALSISVYAERFGGVLKTLEILMRAAEAAEAATGVGIGFVVAAERHFAVADADALAHIVRDNAGSLRIHGRPGVVGFGLHGSEEGFPPAPFANAFRTACDGTGVASLPHAGEIAPAPGKGAESVRDAITILKAKRIGHGVLAHDDPAVLQLAKEKNICFDVCPTSNYLLSAVESVAAHPLPKLLAAGVPCTINSDDSLLFGSSLLNEYALCRSELRMDDATLAACARASFEHSCAPAEVVARGVAGVEAWLRATEEAA